MSSEVCHLQEGGETIWSETKRAFSLKLLYRLLPFPPRSWKKSVGCIIVIQYVQLSRSVEILIMTMCWPLSKPDVLAFCWLQSSVRSTSITFPNQCITFHIQPHLKSNCHPPIETPPSGSLSVASMTSQHKLTGNIGSRLSGLNAVSQTSWYPGIRQYVQCPL